MQIEPGVHRIGSCDVDAVRRDAERAGYTTFVLPPGIADRDAFFDAVRATLPLEPPALSNRSWEALDDSLWEGLFEHEAARIAVIWLGATMPARDFELALSVFANVAGVIGEARYTCDRPKAVAFLVE